MSKFTHIIHTHPIMEKKLNVPAGHVIVDEVEFQKAWEVMRRMENVAKKTANRVISGEQNENST